MQEFFFLLQYCQRVMSFNYQRCPVKQWEWMIMRITEKEYLCLWHLSENTLNWMWWIRTFIISIFSLFGRMLGWVESSSCQFQDVINDSIRKQVSISVWSDYSNFLWQRRTTENYWRISFGRFPMKIIDKERLQGVFSEIIFCFSIHRKISSKEFLIILVIYDFLLVKVICES